MLFLCSQKFVVLTGVGVDATAHVLLAPLVVIPFGIQATNWPGPFDWLIFVFPQGWPVQPYQV